MSARLIRLQAVDEGRDPKQDQYLREILSEILQFPPLNESTIGQEVDRLIQAAQPVILEPIWIQALPRAKVRAAAAVVALARQYHPEIEVLELPRRFQFSEHVALVAAQYGTTVIQPIWRPLTANPRVIVFKGYAVIDPLGTF